MPASVKKLLSIALTALPLLLAGPLPIAAYTDHRGYNLDSLERVVAGRTAEMDAAAPQGECENVVNAYYSLMCGYRNINGDRSMFFARKSFEMARRWNWLAREFDGLRGIGLVFFGREEYDSALVYLFRAQDVVDRMAAGETSFTSDKPYEETTVDDNYSSLYGTIGNVYNMMDSIPRAMEYYRKAGEIFEKHGWNESNSILWYNMGETWYEEGEIDRAMDCYQESLRYARASGDSLQVSSAMKGIGAVYLSKGKTRKALSCLQVADEYFSVHQDQEFVSRLETLDFMGNVLSLQKKRSLITAVILAVMSLLLAAMLVLVHNAAVLRRKQAGADEAIEDALLLENGKTPAASPGEIPDLTDRELQILPLLASGLTSNQIADKVCLSLPTIKWYRKRLMEKFDVTNTAGLISSAKEKGII